MTKVETSAPFFDHNATAAKLLFLMILAVAFCSSVILGFLTPVPLVIAALLYGRLAMLGLSVLMIVGFAALSVTAGFPWFFAGAFFVAFLFAFLVSEIIYRNINPVKGLIYSGLIVVVLSGLSILAFEKNSAKSLRDVMSEPVTKMVAELKREKAKQNLAAEDEKSTDMVIANLENFSKNFYSSLPSSVFIVSYFGLWISLCASLRNTIVWRYKVHYSYALKDLIQFKVPDFFVFPLILSLVLYLGVDYGLPPISAVIGENLLYCLGVLYLFQGFGVYSDFLKYLRIGGWVKLMFVSFTLFLAPMFLAILGMFDLWFDFRRFFTNSKKDEGDTI